MSSLPNNLVEETERTNAVSTFESRVIKEKATWPGILVWVVVAAVAFHLAYLSAKTVFFAVVYLFALLQLTKGETCRKRFYPGLVVGVAIAGVQLAFFWKIFSQGAIALWFVYAFWIALFVALVPVCRALPGWTRWLAVPFLWTGLEYFRSELYYLRFSWLSPGYGFAEGGWESVFRNLGTYGFGFVLMGVACAGAAWWKRSRARALAILFAGAGMIYVAGWMFDSPRTGAARTQVKVTGIQMEFPTEKEVLLRLDELVKRHPETELIVLSEYVFDEPVPQKVREWCRKSGKYLIAGGKAPLGSTNFYDTAFVVAPSGEVVFQQTKAVPIQFMKDGLPAPEQRVWDSSWGKIGMCVCYDLSYTRVTDRLVRQGAQALIVPTMDVADWGEWQHRLHARIAPVRAAEYGLPIFRLASSGISQVVDGTGKVAAKTDCFADGVMLCGTLELKGPGKLPLDRWLGPLSTSATVLLVGWALVRRRLGKHENSDEKRANAIG
jgi:apolipoprotein N-acyltransferase